MTVHLHTDAPHVPAPPSPTCPIGEGRHRWRMRGRWPGTDRCSAPLRMVCLNCAERCAMDCGTRHVTRCGLCSDRYRRNLVRCASYGLAVPGRQGPRWALGMLTVTAPGTGPHRRWALGGSNRNQPMCTCRLQAASAHDLGEWNAATPAMWNRLRTALARDYPGLEFFKASEVQKRGALHLHALLAVPGGRVDLRRVQSLVMAAGFGCVLDWAPIEPGSQKAARYVGKYVTKDAEQDQVPWSREVVDERTGELTVETLARFRPWTASRHWGLTMGELRRLRRVAAARSAAQLRSSGSDESAGTLAVGEGVGAVFSGPLDSG